MKKQTKPDMRVICRFCKRKVNFNVAGTGDAYLEEHFKPGQSWYRCIGSNTKCTCRDCKEKRK